MGVTGLSVAWRLAHLLWGVPEVISLVIAAVAVIAFALIVLGYAIKLGTAFGAVHQEFRHPIAGNLFGTVLISLLQLPIVLAPFAMPFDGTFYSVEWYYGYSGWSSGDRVYLTGASGSAEMVSRDHEEESATVWVEELEDD